jgi:hypothetical protein
MNVKRINVIYGFGAIILIPLVLWLILALKPGDRPENLSKPKYKISDTCLKLLHNGYLVLRTGNDATSEMIRNMSKMNQTYSHAGIVVLEHGYPFIYHCVGGENNWANALRRDSFCRFVSGQNNLGFAIVKYDIDSICTGRIMAALNEYRIKRPAFDLDFDLETDDRLYCSEMIYKALIKATGDTGYIATTKLKDIKYIAIDNLFMNKHATVVCELRY